MYPYVTTSVLLHAIPVLDKYSYIQDQYSYILPLYWVSTSTYVLDPYFYILPLYWIRNVIKACVPCEQCCVV